MVALLRLMIQAAFKAVLDAMRKQFIRRMFRAAVRAVVRAVRAMFRSFRAMARTSSRPPAGLQMSKFFFDRQKVLRAADRGKVRALARFGAYVRAVAKRSMRRRKGGVSAPGSPPFAKKGQLRDLLYFAYDPQTKSVVVGPEGFNGSPVPAFHEHGGSELATGRVIFLKNSPGRDASGRFVSKGARRVELRGTIRYPKRPFMRPAMMTALPKFAESFRGVVTA